MLHNFSTSFNQSDTIDGKKPTFLKKILYYIPTYMIFQKKTIVKKVAIFFLKNQVNIPK